MDGIVIKNLSFSYDEKNVFNKFFARFPSGKMSMIMGASGKGKTTLLYLMAGLLKCDEGSIKYSCNNPKFAVVFQDDRLIETLSIEKNLRLVDSNLQEEDIKICLDRLGLNFPLNKKVKELSGGEKRRVAIARALLSNYDILLLDEPFTGLDDNNKLQVREYLKEKTSGKTVVVVTHDKDEIFHLDGEVVNL